MSCSPPRKCIQIRPRNDQFQIKFNRKFYFPRATSSNFNCKDEKKEKQETNDHGDGRTSWEPVQRERKREREAGKKTKKKRNSSTIFIQGTECILQGSEGRRWRLDKSSNTQAEADEKFERIRCFIYHSSDQLCDAIRLVARGLASWLPHVNLLESLWLWWDPCPCKALQLWVNFPSVIFNYS